MRPGDSFRFVPLLALVVLATPAGAQIPDPNLSSVDPVVVFCPAGDDTFHVTVRRIGTGAPVRSSAVALTLDACLAVSVCPTTGTESYTYQPATRIASTLGDNAGLALLPVRAGGLCAAGNVDVYADGVLLATRALASPDQDGNGIVDGQDLALLQLKLGSADPTGDLDGDGVVTGADFARLQFHAGHACNGATPAQRDTWGRVKTIYR